MVFDQMRAAVEAAAVDRLGEVAAAVWQAYGAGGLTDEQAEQLDGLLNARRGAARAAQVRVQTLATACAQVLPATAPASGQVAAPVRAHHRRGSRPRTPASMARRRDLAANGFLPPRLAALFTLGEQAVLAVVAKQAATRGACTLALGQIAALAGVCVSTAKRALRQAALVGLVSIELRKLTGWRNDTNVVRITSREWASWLRRRLPRSAHPSLGGGVKTVAPTGTASDFKGSAARFRPGQGPIAGPPSTTRHGQRAAGA